MLDKHNLVCAEKLLGDDDAAQCIVGRCTCLRERQATATTYIALDEIKGGGGFFLASLRCE